MEPRPPIRTPDQRLRVFVSSTLAELAAERRAVRRAVERLRLAPVLFELGARPHPPRELYRAYLAQSHVFVGVYWQRYGWVAPGDEISGLEDEYRLSAGLPRLLYLKDPAPDREPRLQALLADVKADDQASYRRFSTPDELEQLVAEDLSLLLTERFEAAAGSAAPAPSLARPPRPLTATVGRDADVAAAVARLRGGARLLTLTGPGGIGKSRLALEVADAVAELFPDGVRFVALADVTDPDLVGIAIAERLGVRVEGTSRAVDALAAFLGGQRLLLVLDNLEQVVAAGPELVALLERAPELVMLATSRRPLRVGGEQELPVGPLAVPRPGASPREIATCPSVELLVDRARAVGADVAVDEDADTLAELVRRLDGLPLAIEIAAARVRLLGPAALLTRLGGHLDLAGGRADAPARHRTLRATIDWSHALLDEPQRALFARFSVFAGGATLGAVEEVCVDAGDEDAGALLDTVAALLDASLIEHDRDRSGGEPRLRMLETVRAYAAEELVARGEETALRARFLDHVLRLTGQAQPFLCGPEQASWAARLDPERANLRAAVATALAQDRVADALTLAWDTFVYYYVRDAFAEPRGWVAEIAARRDELGDVDGARLDVAFAIAGGGGRETDIVLLLERAAEALDAAGCVLELAVARFYLGLARWQAGDADAALAGLAASAGGYAALDHDWGVATAETTAGTILTATGAREEAAVHHRRALVHAEAIDNRPLVLQAVLGLAVVDALAGRGGNAVTGLAAAVDLARQEAWSSGAAYCAEAFAVAAFAEERPEAGVRALASAAAMRARLGTPGWTASAPVVDELVASARRRLGDDEFRRCWQAGGRVEPLALIDEELARLGGDPSDGAPLSAPAGA